MRKLQNQTAQQLRPRPIVLNFDSKELQPCRQGPEELNSACSSHNEGSLAACFQDSCNRKWSQVTKATQTEVLPASIRLHWRLSKTLQNIFWWIQWRRWVSISKLTTRRTNQLSISGQSHCIPKSGNIGPRTRPWWCQKTNELCNRFPRFSCNPEWSQVIPRIHWGMINQHRTSQKTLENYWQRFFQWIHGSNGGDQSPSQNWRLEEEMFPKVTEFQKMTKSVPGGVTELCCMMNLKVDC